MVDDPDGPAGQLGVTVRPPQVFDESTGQFLKDPLGHEEAHPLTEGAFEQISKKGGKDALEVFNQALSNSRPMVEVKSRRVGGANFQVPVEVRPIRRMALAMRWLREAARKRSEKSMGQRLAAELMEAAEGRGGAVKKREEVHRMAEANKAFSHFRF